MSQTRGVEGIRTHHIEHLRALLEASGSIESAYKKMEVRYKLGNEEERRRFLDAKKHLGEAVRTGNYFDIGERPDAICRACLNPFCDCGDSPILQRGNKNEIARMKEVWRQVVNRADAFPDMRGHGLYCSLVDGILSEVSE